MFHRQPTSGRWNGRISDQNGWWKQFGHARSTPVCRACQQTCCWPEIDFQGSLHIFILHESSCIPLTFLISVSFNSDTPLHQAILPLISRPPHLLICRSVALRNIILRPINPYTYPPVWRLADLSPAPQYGWRWKKKGPSIRSIQFLQESFRQ